MTEPAPTPSPRTLYHLRRAERLTRRLRFEAPRLTPAECAALTSRITHHKAKAKSLARATPRSPLP